MLPPLEIAASGPLVSWQPAAGHHDVPDGRVRGLLAGLLVAAGIALPLHPEGGNPWVPGTFVLATLAAGSVGGAIFGPVAWKATTDRAWLWAIVGLAAGAIVIGAAVVGLLLGLAASASGGPRDPLEAVVAMVVVTVLFGVPTLGLFMFPVALAAASTWALLMAVMRPRSAGPRPVSR